MMKKFISLALVLVLAIGTITTVSYASDTVVNEEQPTGTTGEIAPRSTAAVGFTTKRYSGTKAGASVTVNFSRVADDALVTITLQKKSNGSWVKASDIYGYNVTYKGSNRNYILTDDTWTVKSGVLYRVRCISKDSYDSGSSYSSTTYSDPF